MALIKCMECGNEISDKAITCIHCGYPIQADNANVEEDDKQKQVADIVSRFPKRISGIKAIMEEMQLDYSTALHLYNVETEKRKEQKKVKHVQKKCPKCGGSHFHAFVQEEVLVPAKVKTKTSLNLNPLKPFTVFNHKEKVVRREVTRQVSKFVCDDCGNIFQ